jgi:hypothetical protein
MKNLHFTQAQVTKILEEIAIKENSLQDLLFFHESEHNELPLI